MMELGSIPTIATSFLGTVLSKLPQRLSLIQADITQLKIDAIVNAANKSLLGGGGVDGCIHRAAGPSLLEECKTLGGCATGSAKITGGHGLPASHIIHCVGPTDGSHDSLRSCYETAFQLCLENNLKSVAFPCIATGIYGFPNKDAARIAIDTTCVFLNAHPQIERVVFCCFLDQDMTIYKQLLISKFN